MRRTIFALLIVLTTVTAAERPEPASASELAAITQRGRALAEYDDAAWHATDAVMALNPDRSTLGRYIAKKTETGWAVVFGRLNQPRDRFLIAYEATRETGSKDFSVTKCDPVREDASFFLYAARALDVALADFKGQQRPYNAAVLPSESGGLYVYVVPAQTEDDVFPLGGDARYLLAADGSRILAKRQLHMSILEIRQSASTVAGFHTAVLDDVPEDTDVFHVLTRKPSSPEYVAMKKFVYLVDADGSIKYLMTSDAFRKVPTK